MVDLALPFRHATPDDAAALAELINFAGEGLPLYLWNKLAAPGESAWDVGRRRALREAGSFSYRNAVVAEADGRIVASLVGYALPDAPEPIDYDQMPPIFVPLQELENLAPQTWYVNVLATYPAYRSGLWHSAAGHCRPVRGRHGQHRTEHHRIGCECGGTAAVQTLRLSRARAPRHGQRGLGEPGRELGAPDQGAGPDVAIGKLIVHGPRQRGDWRSPDSRPEPAPGRGYGNDASRGPARAECAGTSPGPRSTIGIHRAGSTSGSMEPAARGGVA
jgi:hypothetical protein